MKRYPKLIPFVLFFLLISTNEVQAADHHVTSASELHAALNFAQSNGEDDAIFLSAGTYNDSFSFIPVETENYALTIEPEPGVEASQVILEGTSFNTILNIEDPTCEGGGTCGPDHAVYHIEEMTFQNGCRGIRIAADKGADVTIAGNIIQSNTLGACSFAGIYCQVNTGNLTLDNNVFRNNYSGSSTAGTVYLYTNNGSTTITDNKVQNNAWGGLKAFNFTIDLDTDPLELMRITNNIITDNTGNFGLYANLMRVKLDLINNTICNNIGNGVYLRLLHTDAAGNIYNNVVRNNDSDDFDNSNTTGTHYNAFNNDYHRLNGSWESQGNNIDVDPRFVDASNGNYHLQSNSLCIDQGHNSAPSLPTQDYEGDTRKYDGDENGSDVVDIGADEFVGPFSICDGDFEPDGDVDGSDLYGYIYNAMGISLGDFAANFGKEDCSN